MILLMITLFFTTGMADHVLKSIPKIENNYSIFELGCGTGAILKHIRDVYGPEIKIGGSDLSFYAIEKIRKVFPKEISIKKYFSKISATLVDTLKIYFYNF